MSVRLFDVDDWWASLFRQAPPKGASAKRLMAWWEEQVWIAQNDVNHFIELSMKDDQDPFMPAFRQQWFHREWQDLWEHNRLTVMHGATGFGKCLAPDTLVLLADGSRKRADEVTEGDTLLGPDSMPRRVLSTTRGRGPMFRIVPTKGAPWVCNDVHVLTLVHTTTGHVIDIPLDEYLRQHRTFKHCHKLFFPRGGVTFAPQPPPEVDPYFLGLWFGDGRKNLTHVVEITNMDPEVTAACQATADAWGLQLVIDATKSAASTLRLSRGGQCPGEPRDGRNPLKTTMQRLVGPCAVIPDVILRGSLDVRRQFLAGFFDSDGHMFLGTVEVSQKRRDYADALLFLARSVGLQATVRCKPTGGVDYWRVIVSGDIATIPMRIARKVAAARQQRKDPSRMGFRVEPLGEGDYAGFTLDGDGRFLLGDCTVTHNTEQMTGRQVWKLGKNPQRRITILGKQQKNGSKLLLKIQRQIEKNPIVRAIFPLLVPGHPWNSEQLRLATAGTDITTNNVEVYGLDGSPQGLRSDEIVADDVIDLENTREEEQRKKVIEFFDTSIQSRSTTYGQLHILANAWHLDDLAFTYSKRPGVKYGCYPAEHPVTGELLWPDFRPRAWLDAKKGTMTPSAYQRMYNCKPRNDDDLLFEAAWFALARQRGQGLTPVREVAAPVLRGGMLTDPMQIHRLSRAVAASMKVVVAVDLATKKKMKQRKSDLTVFFVVGLLPTGDRQVLWVEAGRWNAPTILQKMVEYEQRYHPNRFVVETNAAQQFLADFALATDLFESAIDEFVTSDLKWDEALGIEGIGVEMKAGRWLLPGPAAGESTEAYLGRLSLEERTAYAAIEQAASHLLEFNRQQKHTADDVMAWYFAKEGVLRCLHGVFSRRGGAQTPGEEQRQQQGHAGTAAALLAPPPPVPELPAVPAVPPPPAPVVAPAPAVPPHLLSLLYRS